MNIKRHFKESESRYLVFIYNTVDRVWKKGSDLSRQEVVDFLINTIFGDFDKFVYDYDLSGKKASKQWWYELTWDVLMDALYWLENITRDRGMSFGVLVLDKDNRIIAST